MNTLGDGEENLEFLAQDMPLSAPVAADMQGMPLSAPVAADMQGMPLSAPVADMGQGRRAHPYLPRPSVPDLPRPSAPDLPPPSVPDLPSASVPAPWEVPAAAGVPRNGHADDGGGLAADPQTVKVPPPAPPVSPPPPMHAGLHTSSASEPPEDPNRVILRKQLDALRVRAANASSWLEASSQYAQMINREGVVPVTARFTREDVEFLGRAREEVLGLAELGLRLLELHAPLDAGGISTDPSSPILRCRSCMWRWPCPTFSMLTETVNQLPSGPPLTR
jgi:hypothetical protein